jgi:hypothetical protein
VLGEAGGGWDLNANTVGATAGVDAPADGGDTASSDAHVIGILTGSGMDNAGDGRRVCKRSETRHC